MRLNLFCTGLGLSLILWMASSDPGSRAIAQSAAPSEATYQPSAGYQRSTGYPLDRSARADTSQQNYFDAVGEPLPPGHGIRSREAAHAQDWDSVLSQAESVWGQEAITWVDNWTVFSGISGSKQPQDFGVNANLGLRLGTDVGIPLIRSAGVGFQAGTAIEWSENAFQVFEFLGEGTSRFQNFITLGVYQRSIHGWNWAIGYDFLNQNSFDTAKLGQWRGRVSWFYSPAVELGVTAQLRSFGDTVIFGGDPVELRTIDQGSIFYRRYFETGAQGTLWLGLSDGHSESNAVLGPAPRRGSSFLFGADILAPLNNHWAIYGETNLISPADTGTVDAFLGLMWYPRGGAAMARQNPFAPVLPVAGNPSFSVDLRQ